MVLLKRRHIGSFVGKSDVDLLLDDRLNTACILADGIQLLLVCVA